VEFEPQPFDVALNFLVFPHTFMDAGSVSASEAMSTSRRKSMVKKTELRSRTIKHYGWMPDRPDVRDHVWGAHGDACGLAGQRQLQPNARLSVIKDNSEVAWAMQLQVRFTSPLFIYYNERVIGGMSDRTVGPDSRRHHERRQTRSAAGDELPLRY
jgi:hypothetical protein